MKHPLRYHTAAMQYRRLRAASRVERVVDAPGTQPANDPSDDHRDHDHDNDHNDDHDRDEAATNIVAAPTAIATILSTDPNSMAQLQCLSLSFRSQLRQAVIVADLSLPIRSDTTTQKPRTRWGENWLWTPRVFQIAGDSGVDCCLDALS